MDKLQLFFDVILTYPERVVIAIITLIVAYGMLYSLQKQDNENPTPSRKNEDWLRNHWKHKASEYRGKIEQGQMIFKK